MTYGRTRGEGRGSHAISFVSLIKYKNFNGAIITQLIACNRCSCQMGQI